MKDLLLSLFMCSFILTAYIEYAYCKPLTESLTKNNNLCEKIRIQIQGRFNNANFCDKDSDCRVANTNVCPFGCYNLVNRKIAVKRIDEMVKQFIENNCSTCVYSCTVPPSKQDIKCKSGKCIDTRF